MKFYTVGYAHWTAKALEDRGSLAIHAAKSFPSEAKALCLRPPFGMVLKDGGIQYISDLPVGAVVATCELVDCIRMTDDFVASDARLTTQERAFGNYAPGRYAWMLDNIMPLPEPVPARGALGLWTWEGAPA